MPSTEQRGGVERETISIIDHEQAVEDAAWRAINIYVKSVAEAEGCVPDQIMDASEEVWSIPGERKDRTRIISYYASEMGVDFSQVRCSCPCHVPAPLPDDHKDGDR